jgi:hypothetical protein
MRKEMNRQVAKVIWIPVSLTITFVLMSGPAYSQAFWYGNPVAEFLDPNTVDAYHDFLVENVIPALRGAFMMFNNNPENDTGTTLYDPDRCWDGYTMLSSQAGYQPDPCGPVYNAFLIDMEGNVVQKWAFTNSGVPMKLLPGGYVMGGTAPPEFEGHLTQLDWDGNKVWEVNLHVHHDHQREGNPVGYYVPGMEPKVDGGKTMLLDHGRPDPNLTTHISDMPLLDDVIWEVDWEGNVTWQWHGWEHFEQMGFDEAAKEGIRTSLVRFMDPNETDYLHTNSASWLGPNKWYDQGDLRFHPDNIIFDCRSNNVTGIIARYDHPDGLWKSGDIIWRVGPDFSEGNPEHKLGQIIGQHHAHMIPQGLPGAGNIMIFDNGGAAGYGSLVPGSIRSTWPNTLRDYSRVIEFDPVTLDIVWEWKQANPTADYDGDGDIKGNERKFFSFYICDAQRLVNGNTLICEGGDGRVIEVTSGGDIVWEYISPFFEEGFFGVSNMTYRAYRYPYSWIPEELLNK